MGSKKEFDTERVFNAPLDKVWQAWTDPEKVAMWWGPNDTTSVKCTWEARPGGQNHIVIKAGKMYGPAEGQEWESHGEFIDVVPNQRLVFTNNPILNGETVAEHRITVSFEAINDKTKVSMHNEVTISKDSKEAQGAIEGIPYGWNQQIDKLTKIMEGKE